MSLAAGVRLGAYEIVELIGSGGMGEVYRARDARLGRDVAVKVLPAAFSKDPDRLQRFEQEARAAAALNHPNVVGVFDIGSHNSAPYVVSELLEGGTLRERLQNGALPVRKAIDIAVHIARGLAAAHAKGILHRDLKPENIFITSEGLTKILDFGLAKLTARDDGPGVSALATASPLTADGIVLGTIGYMSPEQARGRPVDHRTDIFSFGAILYEMLGGRRAFVGETPADSLSAILKEDPPDLPVAERHIPPALVRIVDRCLEKAPSARFQSADDLGFALESLSSGVMTGEVAVATPTFANVWRFWPLAVALLVGVGATLAVSLFFTRPETPSRPQTYRSTIVLPPGVRVASNVPTYGRLAISPDGSMLAVVLTDAASLQSIWVRGLNDLSARPLAGTEGGAYPFWSPDSRFIGFLADGKLKKIAAAGGSPFTIADAPFPSPGTWNQDDVIVFNASRGAGLSRISANGGTPAPVTALTPGTGDVGHSLPYFLPDGKHFFYSAGNNTRTRALCIGSLDPNEKPIDLMDSGSNVMYAQGNLFFARDTVLMVQPFDPQSLQLSGVAVPIAERVASQGAENSSFGAFTVSATGALAYNTGDARTGWRLTWFDRSGRESATIGDAGYFLRISVSPDGRHAAVTLPEPKRNAEDVWVVDLNRGVRSRLTAEEGTEAVGVWAPDGRVIFNSRRSANAFDIFAKVPNSSAPETLVLSDSNLKYPTSVSPDGKFLLFSQRPPSPAASYDIAVLPLSGNDKPRPFIESPSNEIDARFSPDGQWVAYETNASGRNEVWITTFPNPSSRWQVSTAGGEAPRWGKGELFYRSLDRQLMVATIRATTGAPDIGAPKQLFTVPASAGLGYVYEPAPDGQRILVSLVPQAASSSEVSALTLLVNWQSLLHSQ